MANYQLYVHVLLQRNYFKTFCRLFRAHAQRLKIELKQSPLLYGIFPKMTRAENVYCEKQMFFIPVVHVLETRDENGGKKKRT